jgi:hypothetical protein
MTMALVITGAPYAQMAAYCTGKHSDNDVGVAEKAIGSDAPRPAAELHVEQWHDVGRPQVGLLHHTSLVAFGQRIRP